MQRLLILALLLAASVPAVLAEPQRDKQLRYGEHLAQECVACHRRDGKDVGIPGIIFMSEDEFINAMTLYKTGRRANKVMVSVSGSLDEAQIQALAIYFTSFGQPGGQRPASGAEGRK